MRWLVLAVLVGGILARLVYLDADPDYYLWIGYLSDEGRWIAHAREAVLFGHVYALETPIHLILAPIYQLAHYVVFALFGVSVVTSRVLTAVCGSALLVLFWGALRRVATGPALLLGLALLAVESDMVMLSRVAIPEMVVMCFGLAVYLVLVSGPLTARRAFVAGLLLFVATGMKATAAFMVVVFVPILLVLAAEEETPRRRWWRLLAFGGGFGVPMALVAAAGVACCARVGAALVPHIGVIGPFLRPAGVWSILTFFFDDPLAPLFGVWGVLLLVSMMGWMAGGRNLDACSRRYLVTSAIWIAIYGVMMLGLGYAPGRYKVHLLVPMAVHIAVGITALQRFGVTGLADTLSRRGWGSRAGVLTLIALPTAVLISPLLAAAVGVAGADPTRLRLRLVLVAAAVGIAVAVLAALHARHPRALGLFVSFPLVTCLGWVLSRRLGSDLPFWPGDGFAEHAGLWSALLLSALAISWATTSIARRRGAPARAVLVTAGALAYVTVSLLRLVPAYTPPRYTVVEASRHLGGLLAGVSGPVSTRRGEVLFMETKLRFKTVWTRRWISSRPDAMVLALPYALDHRDRLAEAGYCLVHTYEVYISPEFDHGTDNRFDVIHVYVRRPSAPCV